MLILKNKVKSRIFLVTMSIEFKIVFYDLNYLNKKNSEK